MKWRQSKLVRTLTDSVVLVRKNLGLNLLTFFLTKLPLFCRSWIAVKGLGSVKRESKENTQVLDRYLRS